MNKEVKKLIRELKDEGWKLVRICGSGHIKMVNTRGQVTIIPYSPSDGRWLKNKRAELRRLERLPTKQKENHHA